MPSGPMEKLFHTNQLFPSRNFSFWYNRWTHTLTLPECAKVTAQHRDDESTKAHQQTAEINVHKGTSMDSRDQLSVWESYLYFIGLDWTCKAPNPIPMVLTQKPMGGKSPRSMLATHPARYPSPPHEINANVEGEEAFQYKRGDSHIYSTLCYKGRGASKGAKNSR